MAIINIPVTYTTTATAANLNDCNTTIYNEFNGNIDNDNISASAEIAPTKLDLANGFAIVQTKTTGNALTVTRDLAAASTNSPVVQITQDNSGDDQHVVSIQNDGTGHGIHVDQNGNGDAIRIENDGTSFGVIINQNVVLASTKYALKVYSNAAQTNSELVQIHLDNASSSTPALHVRNDGTGYSLSLDQDGAGTALYIDSADTTKQTVIIHSTPTNGMSWLLIEDTDGTDRINLFRSTDIDGRAVMRLGAGYLWVDATGDLRIKSSVPTSDTDGVVVGTQS